MNITTKKALTVRLLQSGRTVEGPLFTVDQIVEQVNKVFPGGKGTTKDCVYYYASKEGIRLQRTGAGIDKAALAQLMAVLEPAKPEQTEETVTETEEPAPTVDVEAMRAEIAAQVEAEVKAREVRVIKGGGKRKTA